MTDLYMSNGDLVANVFGDLVVCSDERNDIIQSVNNMILTRLGENIYHTDIGNDIFNMRVKASDSGIEQVTEESKIAILKDPRISDVSYIDTVRDGSDYIVKYIATSVNGLTINGVVNITSLYD